MSSTFSATDRPRLRQDLAAEAVEEHGVRYVDVIDLESGGEFRFYESEFAVACAMDGERDIAGIVRWASDELGLSATTAEVGQIASTLGGLGYLDVGSVAAQDKRPDVAPAMEAVDTRPAAVAAPAVVIEREPTPAPKPAAKVEPVAVKTPVIDDDLAPGIVVTREAAATINDEFELGASGSSGAGDKANDELVAGNFDLGASGAVAKKTPPMPKTKGIEFGPAGESKPSTEPLSADLTDHLAIKPSDVKEAVRASKVMQAVDIPAELLEEKAPKAEPVKVEAPKAEPVKVEAPKAEPVKVEAPKAEPVNVEAPKAEPAKVEAPKAEPAKVEAPKLDTKAAKVEKAEKVAGKGAKVEKSEKAEKAAEPAKAAKAKEPAKAAKPAVELPPKGKEAAAAAAAAAAAKVDAAAEKKPGTSKVLVLLLLLVIAAAAAFLVWKYVLNKPKAEDGSTQVAPPPKPTTPPPPVAAPPPPSVKLAAVAGAVVSVKSQGGTVETSMEVGTEVKAGERIVRFAGIARASAALEKAKKDAEAAAAVVTDGETKANGDAAKLAALEPKRKAAADKAAAVTAAEAEVAKFVVAAPTDGKVTAAKSKGTVVKVDEEVATVEPVAVGGSLILAKGVSAAAGSKLKLSIKGGSATAECDVTAVDAATNAATFVCPQSDVFVAGAEVVAAP